MPDHVTPVDVLTIKTNTPHLGQHQIKVADTDISCAIGAVKLELQSGNLPQVTLDLVTYLDDTPVDGPAEVIVPQDTADALLAIGWRPPAEPAPEPTEAPDGYLAHPPTRQLANFDQAWALVSTNLDHLIAGWRSVRAASAAAREIDIAAYSAWLKTAAEFDDLAEYLTAAVVRLAAAPEGDTPEGGE